MTQKPIQHKTVANLTDEERRQLAGEVKLSNRHDLTTLSLPSFDEVYRQTQNIAEQFAAAIKSSHEAFLQTSREMKGPIGYVADHGVTDGQSLICRTCSFRLDAALPIT